MRNDFTGWARDLPDPRDRSFTGFCGRRRIPARVDLTGFFPPPKKTAYSPAVSALALVIEAYLNRAANFAEVSRFFIESRAFAIDKGPVPTIRDVIKAVAQSGAPASGEYPDDARKSPRGGTVRRARIAFRIAEYLRIFANEPDELRRAVAGGMPVIFGFSVPSSFERIRVRRFGTMAAPEPGERVIGGMVGVVGGYAARTHEFFAALAAGPEWGKGGIVRMPESFLADPRWCADFWVVVPETDDAAPTRDHV